LLPMRPQCRGYCLSPSAALGDWGAYDLSGVLGHMVEMRPTAVVARTPFAEFLTQRHILSMKRGNDQQTVLKLEGHGLPQQTIPVVDFANASKLFVTPGIKEVALCLVLYGNHGSLLSTLRVASTTTSIEAHNV
jgi:hypothetical protein